MVELVVIAVGLAMDAFAVAICKGLNMRKLDYKQTALIALFFGGFQAGMPLIGWFIGSRFAHYVESIDHWVTFILLAIIGGKMIFEAIKGEDECDECGDKRLNLKELTALAIATSIDAFSSGITLLLSGNTILFPALLIGIITFINSLFGFWGGFILKGCSSFCLEILGGVILLGLGIKALF